MLAMDVVDTLRHRERLVERELNEEVREEQLIERLRALYKSQGIEVPDSIIARGRQGAQGEPLRLYAAQTELLARTPGERSGSGARLMANGSRRARAVIASSLASISIGVVRPREQAAEAARIEIAETLPRAADGGAPGGRRGNAGRECARAGRCHARPGPGRARSRQCGGQRARRSPSSTGWRLCCGRNTCCASPGGPQDQTGFFREHPSFSGRAYFVVVDAVDRAAIRCSLPIRNDETNQTETVSRFAVRVPIETFDAVRNDKAAERHRAERAAWLRNGAAISSPSSGCRSLEGRITRW